MKLLKLITLETAFIFALSGCTNLNIASSPQTQYQKKSISQRDQALKNIVRWHINGAFSMQKTTPQGKKSIIANYDWQQNKDSYVINIYSSLHIYNVHIVGNAKQVTLFSSDKKQYTAKTPEALMQQQFGWALPISNLFHWIRSLPAPGTYRREVDSYGHLLQLQQSQWTIYFSRYLSIKGVDLPQILQLNNGPLAVKIVIKQMEAIGH